MPVRLQSGKKSISDAIITSKSVRHFDFQHGDGSRFFWGVFTNLRPGFTVHMPAGSALVLPTILSTFGTILFHNVHIYFRDVHKKVKWPAWYATLAT